MTDAVLPRVAEALGRSIEQLVELDRRDLRLAFVPGNYVTVTIRDRATRELIEPTLDLETGELVSVDSLRQQERAAAAEVAMAPELVDLILRHPDLASIQVHLTRQDGTGETRLTDAPGAVALARTNGVARVALAAEPEIPD